MRLKSTPDGTRTNDWLTSLSAAQTGHKYLDGIGLLAANQMVRSRVSQAKSTVRLLVVNESTDHEPVVHVIYS